MLYLEDNFLIIPAYCLLVVHRQPYQRNVLLDLLVTNTSELTGDIEIGDNPSCSDLHWWSLHILRDVGQVRAKVRPVNFRKANFQIFRETVRRIPWKTVHRNMEESW